MSIMKFKTEAELVNKFIQQALLPYEFEVNNDPFEFEYCREFEILAKEGLRRFDLMIINHSLKRYDILEFKNRELMLKDAYQVYGYMKAFIREFHFGKGQVFNKDYKYCFHLIGKVNEDERIDNLIIMNSPIFKVHYFFGGTNHLDVYEQSYLDPFSFK